MSPNQMVIDTRIISNILLLYCTIFLQKCSKRASLGPNYQWKGTDKALAPGLEPRTGESLGLYNTPGPRIEIAETHLPYHNFLSTSVFIEDV
jgi:hypothetical protein